MLINCLCVNFWLFVLLFLFNVFVRLLLWCTFLLGEVAVDLDNCIVFSLSPRQVTICHLANKQNLIWFGNGKHHKTQALLHAGPDLPYGALVQCQGPAPRLGHKNCKTFLFSSHFVGLWQALPNSSDRKNQPYTITTWDLQKRVWVMR